jgi:hypothetical protein
MYSPPFNIRFNEFLSGNVSFNATLSIKDYRN